MAALDLYDVVRTGKGRDTGKSGVVDRSATPKLFCVFFVTVVVMYVGVSALLVDMAQIAIAKISN